MTPDKRPVDGELQAKFREFYDARVDERGRTRRYTHTEIAQMLGVSTTRITKYANAEGTVEGDVEDLENRIRDVLHAASRRKVDDGVPFETNVTRLVAASIEQVRKTNDCGLISGPAGIGKSRGADMYMASHATAVKVVASEWASDGRAVQALLLDAIDAHDLKSNQGRGAYLVGRFVSSNRPIIVDNAQRLTSSGRKWLFDFHDATGCPIVLLGNPEVLKAIRLSDQHLSRIGIRQDVALDQKAIPSYARQIVDRLVPSPDKSLYDLAIAVARQQGHLRALKKQLNLMLDLAAAPSIGGDQIQAFHLAHARLVRDYDL